VVGSSNTSGDGLWNSETKGHPGAFLRVEDDGNVVIYDQNVADYVIWHRGLWPW
jgi:bacillolysin